MLSAPEVGIRTRSPNSRPSVRRRIGTSTTSSSPTCPIRSHGARSAEVSACRNRGCSAAGDPHSVSRRIAAEEAIGGFPSDEFCTAQAHLETAQDGAQRNTAIGEMQNAWGDDAPAEIVDALDTLLEGDLTPERYIAAERALVEVCG